MRDYANRAPTWVPYTMFVSQPGAQFPSFSTDAYGFRFTPHRGKRFSFGTYDGEGPVNLLVGGSTAFGVGATGDGRTVSGRLSENSDVPWISLALRSYNSFQELLAYLLFFPRFAIRSVVLFSGLNNVTLGILVPDASAIYPSFYFQSEYLRKMSELRRPAARRSIFRRGLVRAVAKSGPSEPTDHMKNLRDNYDKVLGWFERDLRIWKDFSRLKGFQLHFVQQPVAFFHDKQLTDEEVRLFGALNELQDSSWPKLEQALVAVRHRYPADVRRVCDSLDVPYYDANECNRLNAREWLYVDRAHMTDRGYQICAEEILDRL